MDSLTGRILDWVMSAAGVLCCGIVTIFWRVQEITNKKLEDRVNKLEERFDQEYMKTLREIQKDMSDLNTSHMVLANTVQNLNKNLDEHKDLIDQRLESMIDRTSKPIQDMLEKLMDSLKG